MHSTRDIAGFTDQLVADCGLDTASVFFVDQSGEAPRVSYVHHFGVSGEAQHVYAERRVFVADPFAASASGDTQFIRWGDPRIDALADERGDYRAFLAQHDIGVVGALSRRVTSRLSLIVGTHRYRKSRHAGDVPMALLDDRLRRLSDMVVDNLMEDLMAHSAGQIALRAALPCVGSASDADVALSRRESQIAALICEGKQNKQVAFQLAISEFTVENHLRRMYRKLGIHSRAALVAKFARQLH